MLDRGNGREVMRMARKVVKVAKGPLEIKPQPQSVWVCMCGLSKNQPYCDGSHKAVQDEPKDAVYEYDDQGRRHTVS